MSNQHRALPATIATLALGMAVAGASEPDAAPASPPPGTILAKVGFDQNLGAPVPGDLAFRDESGRSVTFADYYGERPVLLVLGYYRCPLLCGQALNGLARSLKPLAIDPGTDFDVVMVSIDPEEGPQQARAAKAGVVGRYGRPGTEKGWHFLTGAAREIERLARTVGFRYSYDERTRQYSHAAGLVMLTPDGRIARYFYGIDASPRDLQFGLAETSSGKVGSPIARLLLLCYSYDAAAGRYTLAIVGLIRALGTATALALGAYLLHMFRRERRTAARPAPAPTALEA